MGKLREHFLEDKWPWIILCLGIAITAEAAWKISLRNKSTIAETSHATVEQLAEKTLQYIYRYQYGLRGARGAIVVAGEEGISKESYHRYGQTRNIETEFPGARGFGFIRRVAPSQLSTFIKNTRQDGRPDFTVRQLKEHDGDLYVIQYMEPPSRNLSGMGFDIASESLRRTAAESAMRTGQVTLTAPITLLQSNTMPQQAFLILLPVYRDGVQPVTPSEREASTIGWTFAPLVMPEVLAQLELDPTVSQLVLHDVTDPNLSVQFYQSAGNASNRLPVSITTVEREIFGRKWQFTFKATPLFVEQLHLIAPLYVLVEGTLTSVLCAALYAIWNINRRRKFRLAEEQAKLAAIVESSIDGIIGKSLGGVINSWNRGAEEMFGFTAEEAVGKRLGQLIVPDDMQAEEADILARVGRGERVSSFHTRRLRKDGSLLDVSVSVSPIYNAQNQIIGASKTVRDISQIVAAEARIHELNSGLEQLVERRTAELDAARRALRTVLDSVPSMIGYWDKNLINQVANRAYHQWYNVAPDTLPGTHMQDLLSAETFTKIYPYIQHALEGDAQTYERNAEREDGKLGHLLVHYMPDKIDNVVQGFYVVAHDVTELVESRLKLALALRENEALLRTINEQLLYSVTDVEGRIIEANNNFCWASGYKRDQLLGQNHRILNSGEHDFAFWKNMWETIAGGHAWHGEICNQSRDGTKLWFDTVIAAYFGENGEIERYVALRIDITARKAAEAEINRLNVLLRDVLRSASEVAIIATNVDGIITVFNQGAQRLLGYREDEMVGLCTLVRIHLQEEVVARGRELSAQYGMPIEGCRVFFHEPEINGADTREWTYVRKDLSQLPVSLVVTAMRDDNDAVIGYLGMAQDISKRKEIEANILHAKQQADQANAAKGQFLANMSHEIRTPMNAVLGMLQLVQKTDLNERQLDYILKAQNAGKALLGLLNDILDFSKIEAGKLQLELQVFDLEELMRDLTIVLSGNQTEKGVEVIFELAPSLPVRLAGDRFRLQQVLINLAGNALKFTHFGHVIVSLTELARDGNNISLRISVSDTGIGIHPDQVENIFNGFTQAEASTTRKYGGTGLGLAISKRLVGLMGGVLQVESEQGKGSRFWFDLTLAMAEDQPTTALPSIRTSSLRILVVDDNAVAGKMLTSMIEGLGWESDYAQSGLSALAKIHHAITGKKRYDAVLVDWYMQDLNGHETATLINRDAAEARPPIVMMVTTIEQEYLNQFIGVKSAPFAAFLTKPATPRQLAESVLQSISGNGNGGAETQPKPAIESVKRLSGKLLLVVEDNALSRQVASELLTDEGAVVDLAEGGLQGIKMVTQGSSSYDAVIMDMQMPGMDGLEATRRIRADPRFRDLPILAMTANVSPADKEQCLAAGMSDHVGKPINIDEVVSRLHGVFQTHSRKPERIKEMKTEEPNTLVEPIESLLNRFGGNIGPYRSSLPYFEPECKRLLQELQERLDTKNWAGLAASLHAIKGVAGNMGATALAKSAAEFEKRAKQHASQSDGDEPLSQEDISTMTSLVHDSVIKLNEALAAVPEQGKKPRQQFPATTTHTWGKQLTEMLRLLRAGNMAAVDLVDELHSSAPKHQQEEIGTIGELVQGLQFEAAAELIQDLLKNAK